MAKCLKCNEEIKFGRLLPCIDIETARPCAVSGWWAFDDPVGCPVFKPDPVIKVLERRAGAAKSLAEHHWGLGNYDRAKVWIGRMDRHLGEIRRVCDEI